MTWPLWRMANSTAEERRVDGPTMPFDSFKAVGHAYVQGIRRLNQFTSLFVSRPYTAPGPPQPSLHGLSSTVNTAAQVPDNDILMDSPFDVDQLRPLITMARLGLPIAVMYEQRGVFHTDQGVRGYARALSDYNNSVSPGIQTHFMVGRNEHAILIAGTNSPFTPPAMQVAFNERRLETAIVNICQSVYTSAANYDIGPATTFTVEDVNWRLIYDIIAGWTPAGTVLSYEQRDQAPLYVQIIKIFIRQAGRSIMHTDGLFDDPKPTRCLHMTVADAKRYVDDWAIRNHAEASLPKILDMPAEQLTHFLRLWAEPPAEICRLAGNPPV